MRRVFLLCAVAALGAVLFAPRAGAHALLLSSDPEDGASLATPPTRILLRFTERADLKLSSFRVLSGSAEAQAGLPRALPQNAVEIPLVSRLAVGAYTVQWRVVSTVDGHLTTGAFGFGVGTAAPETMQSGTVAADATQSPSPVSVTGRWLLYAGMAMLVGAAAGGLIVHRRALPSWPIALPACWVAAFAGLSLQVAAELTRSNSGLGSFLGSGRGASLVRVGAALAVAGIATMLVAIRPARVSLAVLGLASAGAMLAQAAAGHAAAGTRAPATVAVQWVHLLGTGVWVGGLPWLLISLRREPDRDAVVRFARLAGVSIAFVAATGAARAIAEVGSPGRLGSTSFGRVVLVKAALFVPLLGMGAVNHYRLVPRLRRDGRPGALRRLVTAEIFFAIAMLAAAGTMAELPPSAQVAAAQEAAEQARPAPVVVEGADFATTIRVRLSISPGTPGPNVLEARVVEYDSRRPVTDLRAVGMRIRRPAQAGGAASSVSLARSGDSWTGRTGAFAVPGEWLVETLVERSNGSATIELKPIIPTPRPRISVAPGDPPVHTAEFAGIGSIQVYADPGSAGPNQVHATFFNTTGGELAIERMSLSLGDEQPALMRFSPGHFVADAELRDGRVRVVVDAMTRDAVPLKVTFTIEITQEES